MKQTTRERSILVAGKDDGGALAGLVAKATEGVVEVDYAPDPAQALENIRSTRPDIVVIGDVGPADALRDFYRRLREGWISRHSFVLILQESPDGDFYRILGDEDLEFRIDRPGLLDHPSNFPISRELLPAALKERIDGKLEARENKLKTSLAVPGGFCLIWEQIPGLGAFERRQEAVLDNARKAAAGGKVCAISVTDNPGGNPAIATEVLSQEIHRMGIEPLVHVAFRDKSRNQVESLLYQLAAMGINNLLVLTGDYPANTGFTGTSRPVFDLDAVNGLQLISEMNRGMEHEILRRRTTLAPTSFFCAVAFSPFKKEEAEVMGQYYKLLKKVRAGTDFLITQVGYDVRKWHELQLWLKARSLKIPALVSIYVLSEGTARAMHANRVPGCVVTDKLMAEVSRDSGRADRGRQARLDRAAKMYAIARGMGFAGASISGLGEPYESVEYIIGKGEELAADWRELVPEFDYPQEDGFYLFQRDAKTGLNVEILAPRQQAPSHPPVYYLSRAVHYSVFEPRGPFFRIMRRLAAFVDGSRTIARMLGSFEFWTKAVLYGCMNCGDCALFDVAFLCPVSQCPKNQRNGPCGGSHDGWCEIYEKEKKCIWVRAYRRLKAQHREDSIAVNIVPPCNWELWNTSSWLNYFMGRDHISRRLGVKPPVPPPLKKAD